MFCCLYDTYSRQWWYFRGDGSSFALVWWENCEDSTVRGKRMRAQSAQARGVSISGLLRSLLMRFWGITGPLAIAAWLQALHRCWRQPSHTRERPVLLQPNYNSTNMRVYFDFLVWTVVRHPPDLPDWLRRPVFMFNDAYYANLLACWHSRL